MKACQLVFENSAHDWSEASLKRTAIIQIQVYIPLGLRILQNFCHFAFICSFEGRIIRPLLKDDY